MTPHKVLNDMVASFAGAGARPSVTDGNCFFTKPAPTQVVCKAYDQPAPDGRCITSIHQGVYSGPVETYLHTDMFTAILIKGYWINVWKRRRGTELGDNFAIKVPQHTIQAWVMNGWQVR